MRALLARTDLLAASRGSPRPDRYVYRFRHADLDVVIHEPALTPELSQLARVVLGE